MNGEIIYYPGEVVSIEGTVRLVERIPHEDTTRYVVSSGVVVSQADEPENYIVLVDDYNQGVSAEAVANIAIMDKEEIVNCNVNVEDKVKVFGTVYETTGTNLFGRFYNGVGEGFVQSLKDELHSIVFFEEFDDYTDLLAIVPNKYITDVKKDGSTPTTSSIEIMHENERYKVEFSKMSYGIRIDKIERMYNPDKSLENSALRTIETYIRNNKEFL